PAPRCCRSSPWRNRLSELSAIRRPRTHDMWRNHAPTDASSLDPSEPNSGAKCRTRDSGHRARQANEVFDALYYDRAEASIFWARPRSRPQLQRVFTAQLPGSAFENLIAAI